MSKKSSSSVLQKRLQDLESELSVAFSLPPHQASSTYQIYNCSQYFVSKFDFLRKLISAEIASLSSSPRPKKQSYLQKVVRRYTELETKFKEWESTCTSKPSTEVDDDHHFELPASTCSCAESFVNDDEKYYEGLAEEKVHADNVEEWLNDNEEEGGFEDEAKKLLEDEKVKNTLMEEVGGGSEVEKELKRKDKKSLLVGKYVGAMAAGLVLGMGLMGAFLVRFSGCFHYVKHHDTFLPPT